MAKAINKKAVESAPATTINPPKASVKEAKVQTPVTGVVETPKLTPEQEKEWERLSAIRRASSVMGSRSRFTSVTRVKTDTDATEYNRLPPQAKLIIDALNTYKTGKATVNELCELMGKTWDTARYRQGPARIVQFYRARLESARLAKFE